jgi:hypothetical protein
MSKHKVFLSYSGRDQTTAHRVWSELKNKGYDAWLDALIPRPGNSWVNNVRDALSASDVLVVLLSETSVKSQWVEWDFKKSLNNEIRKRAITVVPVRIDDCEIPPFFLTQEVIDLSSDFENGLNELEKRVGAVLLIDFTVLDPKRFEALIEDILKESSFFDIEQNWQSEGREFDFKANFRLTDPFGQVTTELWVVETKLYPKERASVSILDEFIGKLQAVPQVDSAILITSGLLTSAANDWLQGNKGRSATRFRVIDGQELREMLSRHPKLVDRYFATEETNE